MEAYLALASEKQFHGAKCVLKRQIFALKVTQVCCYPSLALTYSNEVIHSEVKTRGVSVDCPHIPYAACWLLRNGCCRGQC